MSDINVPETEKINIAFACVTKSLLAVIVTIAIVHVNYLNV